MSKLAEAFIYADKFIGARDHDETQEGWDWYTDRDSKWGEDLVGYLMAASPTEKLFLAEAARRAVAQESTTERAAWFAARYFDAFMTDMYGDDSWAASNPALLAGAPYGEMDEGFLRGLANKLIDAVFHIMWRYDEAPDWCIQQCTRTVDHVIKMLGEASAGERDLLADVLSWRLEEDQSAIAKQTQGGGMAYYHEVRMVEVLAYLWHELFGKSPAPA